jgi:hypothetical protein
MLISNRIKFIKTLVKLQKYTYFRSPKMESEI